jgi:hypothetical protein
MYRSTVTEKSERDRRDMGVFIREVRARVWAWDPVGLAGLGAPDDEYDCLVGPLTGALREGLPADALANRIRNHVIEHFAVEPSGTDIFSAELNAWYRRSGAQFFE